MKRKSLADILPKADRDRLAEAWASTSPAADLAELLPPGEYRCRIVDGRVFTAKTGTPGYKVEFEAIDGEHAGRRLWGDFWLTEQALPYTMRDLARLGITHFEQLERPIPAHLLATVRVALRRDDDGTERNRVVRFEVTGIEPVEPEPFAPSPDGEPSDSPTTDADGFDWRTGQQTEGTTP
jgi:hypothetical protein